ncbi:MAG TPA: DUF2087 domain-containing protein [Anaerolineae bacterium]|nr:DUF2087 domain-containing protein [Anaerolineae bacterium]
MEHVSEALFRKRFVFIVFGARDLPKKRRDRHILFFSATLELEHHQQYREQELNDCLRRWSQRFGDGMNLDHVSLRRNLVDEGYIVRDPAGASYELVRDDLSYTFDPSIQSLDLDALIDEEKAIREKRKQERLKRNRN